MSDIIVSTERNGVLKQVSLSKIFRDYETIARKKDFKKAWIAFKVIEELRSKRIALYFEVFMFIAYKMSYSKRWADERFKDWISWAIENKVIKNREEVINIK